MIGAKSLTALLFLVFSSVATSTENSSAVPTKLGISSFSIEIPEGWSKRALVVNHQGSSPLFDLVPIDAGRPGQSAPSDFYIRVAYYPSKVPMTARLRWESLNPHTTEYPRIDGLPIWSVYGFGARIQTVYAPIGGNVVLFSIRAPDDARYGLAEKALLEILRSYREAGAGD